MTWEDAKEFKIFLRLKSDYDYCKSLGYTVIGVFLFGSQNYGTDTATSDIDVKAVVLPKLEDIVWGRTTVSEKVVRDDGELTIYDIASLHASIKKQSINFVEILFTEYKIVNADYAHLYSPLFVYREKIADLNRFKAVHCTLSMAKNKHKMLFSPSVSNKHRIESAGYDYKAWAEILRLDDFLNSRILGLQYGPSLFSSNRDYFRSLKSNAVLFDPEVVREKADAVVESMSKRVDAFDARFGEVVDDSMIQLIDSVTKSIILQHIKKEVP